MTAAGGRLGAGVIGVGAMGANHARVYAEGTDARLVGVSDADDERAAAVADRHGTAAMAEADLLEAADVVSIAVPTRYHASVARRAIEAGVDVLIEKPYVADPAAGRELAALARERDVVVQVGHVERFNPAVATLLDVIGEGEGEGDAAPVSIRADRLGPPVDRDDRNGVVLDLMIHDIDVVSTLVDGPVETVAAAGAGDGAYCTTQLTFADGPVATLTASRVNQKRVRRLEVAAPDRLVEVDYLNQSVRIHRGASSSYEATDEGVRYRNERVTEHPFVESREPLKCELEAFVEASRTGATPRVTPAEALEALELARRVRERADRPAGADDEGGRA